MIVEILLAAALTVGTFAVLMYVTTHADELIAYVEQVGITEPPTCARCGGVENDPQHALDLTVGTDLLTLEGWHPFTETET